MGKTKDSPFFLEGSIVTQQASISNQLSQSWLPISSMSNRFETERRRDYESVKGAELETIVGLWSGDVLVGSEEDSGQSDDVWDKVGELALRVLGEN